MLLEDISKLIGLALHIGKKITYLPNAEFKLNEIWHT